MIQAVAGRSASLEYEAARQGDIRRNYSLVRKAELVLGWQPRVDLAEGIAETRSWFAAADASWLG